MSDLLKKLLIKEEGIRLSAYTDHLGYWTIGIGRLIDARKSGSITLSEALYLLDNDIKRVTDQLEAALPWTLLLDEVRKAVLVSMAFQMGIDGLLKFRNTLRAVEEGRWADAAAGMRSSLWHRQTPGRAERAARAMESGSASHLLG